LDENIEWHCIQLEFNSIGRKMECKLVKKVKKICFDHSVENKTLNKQDPKKTLFHSSFLENQLNRF
jgi:hypothetical protein